MSFLMGKTVYCTCSANQEAAFQSCDRCTVLEKLFKQTGMAAAQQQNEEFIPISEWDLLLQVSTY